MFENLILRYKNISFHRKLLLSYVVLLLAPFLGLSLFTYHRSSGVIQAQAQQMATQSAQRAAVDLNQLAVSAYRIATVLNQNTRVREIVEKDPAATPAAEQAEDFRYLENMVESLTADDGVYGVRLYVPEGFLYANQKTVTDNLQTLPHTAFSGAGVHFGEVYQRSSLLEGPVRVLPGDFPLYSIARYQQIIGVIRMEYLESTIIESMKGADFTGQGSVYLLNDQNALVTAARPNPEMLALLPQTQDGWYTQRLPDGDALVNRIPLQIQGWHLVTVIPLQSLLMEANALQRHILLFTLGLGAAILFLSQWTARYNSKRILHLARSMQKAQSGDWQVHATVDSEDEIGVLQHSFNYLIRNTRQMMDERYTLGQSLKGMELNALQNQINPHFLYNTLDMIRWTARQGNTEMVEQAVEELSQYYRLSLSKGKTFITLAEELDHVTHYVNLQNFRFQGKLTLQLRVEESLLQAQCVMLILQPIVENAFLHGIMERPDRMGVIRITGERIGGDMLLKVIDDGVGIPSDKLREINSGAAADQSGYGIWNVNQRIRLHYGEGYGLSYESIEGMGTVVNVRLACEP
ncbi:MAG: histidine kinase [Candidatus Limiplasma sp.]|nr:histidine kinase [Candidatus Limiplasma sp.]